MSSTRQQPRWVPPLPPGWEAKFDHGQNTYFFINHQTRTTQWEDPRFSKPSQPAPTASAAATSLRDNTSSSSRHKLRESVPLKEFRLSKSAQRHPLHIKAESSLSSQDNTQLLSQLQAEFPSATRELISDMLSSCQNNEHKTRQQLKDLGFGSSSSTSGSSLSANTAQRGASPKRSASPQARAKTPTQTSPKHELSESEKTQVVNQLRNEFPKVDIDVIRIAASTCSFSIQNARVLVKAWEQKQTAQADKNNQSQGTTSSATSHSSDISGPSQQSLLPAVLSSNGSRPPKRHTGGDSIGSTARSHGHRGSTSTHHSSQPGQSPSRGSRGASRGSHGDGGAGTQPQHARAQQVTRPRGKLTKQAAVTSQPTGTSDRARVETSTKSVAVGPNPELCRGPDRSLLMSDYTQAQGPNSQIRDGPDHSRVAGPQGCQGPDTTLRCGPQSDHLSGSSLGGEGSTASTTAGLLVSSC